MLRVHVDEVAGAELSSSLDAIVAEGARRMLAAALEAEVDAYVSSLIDEVDEHRRRAKPYDTAGGREERIRRRDDFGAGTDAQGHERHEERIRA